MVRRSRPISALIAVLTMALAVVACGACSAKSDSSSSGPVALRMATWTPDPKQLALFKQIGDEYVAEHPDKVSSITFDTLSGDDYVQALSTQIAGGDVPDMAWVQENSALEFVDAGVLKDLMPTFRSTDGYDVDDILPTATKLWTKDGGLFAYPFSSSPFGMYVNLDLLKKADQPTPAELIAQGQWTWDKVAQVAAATSKKTGVAGLYVPYSPSWSDLQTWMLSWGANVWSADGKTCTITSKQSKDFFTWLHDGAYVSGGLTKPGQTANFASGGAAFTTGQMSTSGSLDGSFKWDFVPLPKGPAGQVNVIGQAGVGVVARSAHAQQAADFLAFFTNKTNGAKLAQFFPPPRKSLLNVDTLSKAAPQMTKKQLEDVVIKGGATAVTRPSNAKLSQINDQIRSGLDTVFSENRDLDTSLQQICTDIQPILQGGS